MKLVKWDEHTHAAVWELIPWFVNETLDETEHGRVEAHLRRCPACKCEVDAQSRLRAAMATSDIGQRQAELAWKTLDRRLDRTTVRHPWQAIGVGLAASFAVLAFGFGLNDTASKPPGFVTLSGETRSPDAVRSLALRIRMAPGASEAAVVAVLERAGLSDIGALSDTGLIIAYVPAHIDAAALSDRLMQEASIAYVAGDF
jgi:anti-sigma factor RsiW